MMDAVALIIASALLCWILSILVNWTVDQLKLLINALSRPFNWYQRVKAKREANSRDFLMVKGKKYLL